MARTPGDVLRRAGFAVNAPISNDDSLHRAIHEPITLVPYDPAWPGRYEAERSRLTNLSAPRETFIGKLIAAMA
jgi:GrpB-like predicted nucleotidyltransferase (UPF0157 family)